MIRIPQSTRCAVLLPVFLMLSSEGGMLKAQNQDDFSEMHRAVLKGDLEAVSDLIDQGQDVDVPQAKFRGTPLQYAAAYGKPKLVQFLIDNGATIDAQDSAGRTPLIWAADKGRLEETKLLLDAGADIKATNKGGWTPLHYAIDRGHQKLAQLLIDRGAPLHVKNRPGKTPLDLNQNLELDLPHIPALAEKPPQRELP